MECEVFVDAAQAGDEMLLERMNGAFRSVTTVNFWRHELIIDRFVDHELLEELGTFIVQLLQLVWAQTSGHKSSVDDLISCQDARASSTAEWFDEDAVAVVIIEHKDVVVA